MNNRRSFFKSLIGLIIAPKVAEALPIEAEQDLVRMHGIDIREIILTNMSKAIQGEIDNDMAKKLTKKMGS